MIKMELKIVNFEKGVTTAGDNWNDSAYDTVETPSELTYEFDGRTKHCSDFGATKEELIAKAINNESWNVWFYDMECEDKTFQEVGLTSPVLETEEGEFEVDGIGDFIYNGKGYCSKSLYDKVKEQLLGIALNAVEITVVDENEEVKEEIEGVIDSMRIYFNDEIEDVNVGDEVITTTSTFDYDNVAGTFASDLNAYADVDVEYISSDYSEYDPRTCRDGGNYGYDYYVVTKIHEVGKL